MVEKIKKYKKIIVGAVGIFTVLLVCYLIGQNIVLPNRLAKEGLLSYDGEVPEIAFAQNPEYLFYEEQIASEDFPGGQNVGPITIEENTKVFLITPDTAIRYDFEVTNKTKEVSFVVGYHPLIEEGVADGALLRVETISLPDERVLDEKVIEIPAGVTNEVVEVDVSSYKGQEIRVRIYCEAGAAGDYSGDWIVLKNLVLE